MTRTETNLGLVWLLLTIAVGPEVAVSAEYCRGGKCLRAAGEPLYDGHPAFNSQFSHYGFPEQYRTTPSTLTVGQLALNRSAVVTDAEVLRRRVSVPMERLLEPISIGDLVREHASTVTSDPFSDDPPPQETFVPPATSELHDGFENELPEKRGLVNPGIPAASPESESGDNFSDVDAFGTEPPATDDSNSSNELDDAADEDPFGDF